MAPRSYPDNSLAELQADNSKIIRLLTIVGDATTPGDAPVTVELQRADLHAEDCPAFTAISYTWGQSADRAGIVIRGPTEEIGSLDVPLTVPPLLEALRRLQGPEGKKPRYWIDSICINQQDDVETKGQLPYMRNIYAQAQSVTVWLGPAVEDLAGSAAVADVAVAVPREHIEKAMECIITLGSETTRSMLYHAQAALKRSAGGRGASERQQQDDATATLPEALQASYFWRHVGAFFARPWWERVWTLQEHMLALNVVFRWGDRSIGGSLVNSAAVGLRDMCEIRRVVPWRIWQHAWLRQRITQHRIEKMHDSRVWIEPPAAGQHGRKVRGLRRPGPGPPNVRQSLPVIVAYNSAARTGRLVDRIYGVASLATERDMKITELDVLTALRAKDDVRALYRQFVVEWIREYESLDIVCFAHVFKNDGIDFPSPPLGKRLDRTDSWKDRPRDPCEEDDPGNYEDDQSSNDSSDYESADGTTSENAPARGRRSLVEVFADSCPSWTPDWRASRNTFVVPVMASQRGNPDIGNFAPAFRGSFGHRLYDASGGEKYDTELLAERGTICGLTLVCPGVLIDRIDGLSYAGTHCPLEQSTSPVNVYGPNDPENPNAASPERLAEDLVRCLVLDSQEKYLNTRLTHATLESYVGDVHAMIGGRGKTSKSHSKFRRWFSANARLRFRGQTLEKVVETARPAEEIDVDPDDERETKFVRRFWNRTKGSRMGRRLVTTEGGRWAMTSRLARPGDAICVLRGCSVPVVLRRHGQGGGSGNENDNDVRLWEFVGECYLDGFMQGEGLRQEGGRSEERFELV